MTNPLLDQFSNRFINPLIVEEFISLLPEGSLPSGKITASNIGARVYNSAAIPLSTATTTSLTFNSQRWNTSNLHSTATNTGRFTILIPGRYMIGGSVRYAANATGWRFAGILLNGTTYLVQDKKAAITGTTTDIHVQTIYKLKSGDYVEIQGYQDSGGNLDIEAAGNSSPEFWIEKLADQFI